MALQDLGQTTNFNLRFDPAVAGAQQRAQALLGSCERDFSSLSHLMGEVQVPYGPGNRISLHVVALIGGNPSFFGHNTGYKTGNNSVLEVTVQPGNTDDCVRAVFIAELVEVFNDRLNERGEGGWPENTNFSEGISLAMMSELYPDAYYGTLVRNPRVNDWLRTSRGDKVSAVAGGEGEAIGNGCALLFLNYLRYQRGWSWKKIVSSGGATLAETATKLNDSFLKFAELIGKHLAPGVEIKTENPFPLFDPADRSIRIDFEQVPVEPPRTQSQGVAHVHPFFTCPEKDYRYSIETQRVRLRCVATYYGFAAPEAKWAINGHAVPQAGSIPEFPVTATVEREDPNNPGHHSYGQETVTLYVAGQPRRLQDHDAVRSELTFGHNEYPGRILFDLKVQGYEVTDPASLTEASGVGSMDTLKLVWEDAFYRDREECERRFHDRISHFVHWKDIPIWKTLPDPPESWLEAIRWFDFVRGELVKIAVTEPVVALEMAGAIAATFGIQPQAVLAAPGG